MLQFLRDRLSSFKLSYTVYNFLHQRQLRHNEQLYQRYGLQKRVYAPVSSQDFKALGTGEPARFDAEDSRRTAASYPEFRQFSPAVQAALLPWSERGYVVLRGFFSAGEVATINREIERLIGQGEANWRYERVKIMFAIHQSEEIRRIVSKPELHAVLSFLLGKEVRQPFQSINFQQGSQQKAHSDTIHMTTYPLGYLIAAWIALEPVDAGNGPVFYYPGSHRLPYVLNDDYPHGGTHFTIGESAYQAYEQAIDAVVRQNQLQPEEFHAQPGDVLLWHANLLHGGTPIREAGRTRKSMVLHYFAEDVICYHEITQRPALRQE
jgi:ectoine hydroxylase-related dioxygenase (phytanoyl-CoA dioxygenase family)